VNLAQTIDAMMAADCTREQLAAVVRAHQERLDARAAEKRALAAKRQAAYRERHPKSNADNALRASPSVTERHIASNAPAPAREEVLTSLDSNSKVSKERPPKGGPKKGFKFQLSEDVQPTEKDRAVAEREGMSAATFRLEWQKWRSHHLSEAKPVASLHQSWVKWVSNWVSYGRRQADQPARAGPRSSTNGVVEMLNELNGVGNVEPDHERPAKDITPAKPSEPGGCERPTRLFESARKSSWGETLDLGPASADFRGPTAAYGAARRIG
jgi:hypothetical protein